MLHNWDIHTVKTVRTEKAQPYIDRASVMFTEIQKEHPGSPWSARAQWELKRGFGVDLRPEYDVKYATVENAIPIPKL